jgi:predicted RNA-binding Zn-ribbon protein involved in translation (DUF1610 family)
MRRQKMSKKDLLQQMLVKDTTPSDHENVPPGEPQTEVFYRCTCPECGEDSLELFDFGLFSRSKFLGVTNDGEFGCGHLEIDGEYHWALKCASCGYEALDSDMLSSDTLLDWADAHGQPMKQLEFTCPVCGNNWLDQVEIDLKRKREVRAVYEIMEKSKTKPSAEVALSYEQVVVGEKSVRYCCSMGHELAKNDGSPVATGQELVEWLKAQQAVNKR